MLFVSSDFIGWMSVTTKFINGFLLKFHESLVASMFAMYLHMHCVIQENSYKTKLICTSFHDLVCVSHRVGGEGRWMFEDFGSTLHYAYWCT